MIDPDDTRASRVQALHDARARVDAAHGFDPDDVELLRGAARDVRRQRPRDIGNDALAEALDRAVEAAEAGGVDALRRVTAERDALRTALREWAEADTAEALRLRAERDELRAAVREFRKLYESNPAALAEIEDAAATSMVPGITEDAAATAVRSLRLAILDYGGMAARFIVARARLWALAGEG